MGVIKDIVNIIVPKAQRRIEAEGIGIKDALYIELKEIGYIANKSENMSKEVK